MQLILMTIIALIWTAGTNFRIYRQARFYQIEEYMSMRYLRWLFSERDRYLPLRPLGVFFVGLIFAFFNDSIPEQTAVFPYFISVVTAIIAVFPPREGEIKKAFVRTQRAWRMLITAFGLAIIYAIIS